MGMSDSRKNIKERFQWAVDVAEEVFGKDKVVVEEFDMGNALALAWTRPDGRRNGIRLWSAGGRDEWDLEGKEDIFRRMCEEDLKRVVDKTNVR